MNVPTATWEGREVSALARVWELPLLLVFTEADSTNDIARVCADDGAAAGSLVIAEHQRAGRGRLGRAWRAPPASGLLFSFVLRPPHTADAAPGSLPLRIGLAAARAIRATTRAQLRVKWPNDLVTAAGLKVGGILCEASTGRAADSIVIAGIGLNVRRRAWPPELRDSATAIDEVTGSSCDRLALMAAIVQEMRPLFAAPLLPLTHRELAEFDGLDALKGRNIMVQQAAACMRATAAGIDADGALRILGADGAARVTSATVRIADNTTRGSAP